MTTVNIPVFKNYPDESTPVTAENMQEWGDAIKANADAAEAAVAGATAPTDVVMAAKVADAASLTRAAGNAVWAPSLPSLSAFKAALEAGQTTGYQALTDSTGNDTFEWPYTFAQQLAAAYPAHTVKHMLWDDATQDYLAPTVIQTGTAGVRYMDLVAGDRPRKLEPLSVPHLTGTIDVRVDVTAGDWTPANGWGATVLVGEAGGDGAWGWSLAINTGGILKLYYSVDGTTLLSAPANAVTGIADGTRSWVRCVFTPDDGASQNVAKFYKSTDGITWTQIGSTVTTAGAVVLKDWITAGTYSYLLGGFQACSNVTSFRIHEVDIRNGENGPSVVPRLPDGWGAFGAFVTCPMVGAPVLTVVNGARPGATIAYLDDATRRPRITPDYGQSLTILASSHNETRKTGRSWYAAYAAWVTNVRGRLGTGIVALTQNPQRPAAIYPIEHARRRLDLAGFAKVLGIDVIDTYAAFLAHTGWETDYMADDVHPNATGANVIRDRIKAAFDAS